MGSFIYASAERPVQMDDRTLEHLRIVILSRLRGGGGFAFSWPEPLAAGGGRSTIWIHPAISLTFHVDGTHQAVNHAWVRALTASSYSPGGLRIVPEPEPDADPRP